MFQLLFFSYEMPEKQQPLFTDFLFNIIYFFRGYTQVLQGV